MGINHRVRFVQRRKYLFESVAQNTTSISMEHLDSWLWNYGRDKIIIKPIKKRAVRVKTFGYTDNY